MHPVASFSDDAPRTLNELLSLKAEDLALTDIALMNLLCAQGLPGAEDLDVEDCLATLDGWAERIRFQTDRHLHQFRADPADYENSEGYFRMLILITILQKDLGVRYNPARVLDPDFTNAKDLFIHGMIDDPNGGTCASMPVLYTAVARRLGYPVRLVTTKAHVFCRWDAPGDRVNIEGASRGMHSYDDEHYKTWPLAWTPEDHEAGYYLRSLTAAEELGAFLAMRGHCLLDTGHKGQAIDVYLAAKRLSPASPDYLRRRSEDDAGVARVGGTGISLVEAAHRRERERTQAIMEAPPVYAGPPPAPTPRNITDLWSFRHPAPTPTPLRQRPPGLTHYQDPRSQP